MFGSLKSHTIFIIIPTKIGTTYIIMILLIVIIICFICYSARSKINKRISKYIKIVMHYANNWLANCS